MGAVTAATRAPSQEESTPRDLAITSLVLGIAAMAWFGWGQAQPPAGWRWALIIGMFSSFWIIAFATSLMIRIRRGAGARGDRRLPRAYWIVVGIEVAAIVLGANALALAGLAAYTAPWTLLVVGLHFVPLGRMFGIAELLRAGLVLSAVAIGAAIIGALTAVAPSAVAGGFGGLVMVATAAVSMRHAVRLR
jgi:hypothetical protein